MAHDRCSKSFGTAFFCYLGLVWQVGLLFHLLRFHLFISQISRRTPRGPWSPFFQRRTEMKERWSPPPPSLGGVMMELGPEQYSYKPLNIYINIIPINSLLFFITALTRAWCSVRMSNVLLMPYVTVPVEISWLISVCVRIILPSSFKKGSPSIIW